MVTVGGTSGQGTSFRNPCNLALTKILVFYPKEKNHTSMKGWMHKNMCYSTVYNGEKLK